MADRVDRHPDGAREVKRIFDLPGISHPRDVTMIEDALSNFPGVKDVKSNYSRHRITLRYAVTDTDYLSIAELLEAIGYPLADDRWTRLMARWFQYLDETARANTGSKEAACCNKPPVIRR